MSIDEIIPVGDDSRFGGSNSIGLVEPHSWTCEGTSLELECGKSLSPFTLAYETYGELSPARDNAILILHALTGDAHVAGYYSPDDAKPGWWDLMIGPGKPLDTRRYHVVCSNVLGGCKGSTGAASINPRTGKPYALTFPMVTIGDMVRAQARLMDHLGIPRWLAVMGGSMGGMQALEWAALYPERVESVLAIATAARQSAQGIAFDEVGRRAIMADPNWRGGDYYGREPPHAGLTVARMVGHITYLSEQGMQAKFGRRLQDRQTIGYSFAPEFEVESYLQYQGNSFIKRFDANSYLYITRAIDYYDLAAGYASLAESVARMRARFLVVSFTSNWLYPSHQSLEIVAALRANRIRHTYVELPSTHGHDAFFLPNPEFGRVVGDFVADLLDGSRQRAMLDDARLYRCAPVARPANQLGSLRPKEVAG